jgi:tRNA (cmo5U34)-methyltransferase
MLDRAEQRVRLAGAASITCHQADIRELDLGEQTFDVILAASVLHHLRTDEEWRAVFTAFRRSLRPGGSLWIYDLVDSDLPAVHRLMRDRYAAYLESLGGPDYRDRVFAYIEDEDSPRPLVWQLNLLREAGFSTTEVLHKHACFAAFGALRH